MRTVLLTGGNRFVGHEILARLLLEGFDVTLLALDPPRPELRRHVRWLKANRNHREELGQALSGCRFDAVVDNIAYTPTQLDALLEALGGRFERFVLTSTVDLYGHHLPRACREDQAAVDARAFGGPPAGDTYAQGKLECEKRLRELGIPWTVLRPGMVTGRQDNLSAPPTRALSFWETASRSLFYPSRVLDGGPILIRQDDEAVFRLVWVQDVAAAVLRVLADARTVEQAYNVTGSELWTSASLVRAMCAAAGRPADLVWVSPETLRQAGLESYQPPHGTGPYWSIADNARLRALGWEPTPAEHWMARMLETPLTWGDRAAYASRPAELALANRMRRGSPPPDLVPAAPPPPEAKQRVLPAVLEGSLTPEATERWCQDVMLRAERRGRPVPHPEHFREKGLGRLSRVGIGTWMGDAEPATDGQYIDAIVEAVRSGINVIDTAINYRWMLAERCVGEAIRRLEREGISRGALQISTKGGFVSHDAADERSAEQFLRAEYVKPGLLSDEQVAQGHCIAGPFIRAQLERSLGHLGLKQVDAYFLHNPEVARLLLGPEQFREEILQTFRMLEHAVAEGLLREYGVASWDGLLLPQADAGALQLGELVELAREAGGELHHFRILQIPCNPHKLEAYRYRNQHYVGEVYPTLELARRLGLYVYTSGSVLQGGQVPAELAHRLPVVAGGGDVARVLQLTRSLPGVGTALVGMRRLSHVEEAGRVAALAPLSLEQVGMFS